MHGLGREVLPPERTEVSQVRGGPRTRAQVPADMAEPVDGVPLPVWSDLQFVDGNGVGPTPSDACPGRVAAARHFEGRDNGSAITGNGRWLRGGANLAPRATSPSRTVAADQRPTRYGNRK